MPPPVPSNPPNQVTGDEPAARDLEDAITCYLRRATEKFDLTKNVEVRENAEKYLLHMNSHVFAPFLRFF